MKKIYFILSCLLAWMGVSSVQAQEWAEPVAPDNPTEALLAAAADVEAGSAYFMLNVGCGQFVTGANSWSTQISLTTDGMPYLQILAEALSETDEATWPGCIKLKLNGGPYNVNGAGGARSFTDTYLFRDSEGSGFIDRGSQACWYWKLTKVDEEGAAYYWQSAYNEDEGTAMGTFSNAATQYAAGDAAGKAVIFNKTIEDANIEWLFIPVEAVSDDYKEQVEAYKAAAAIYEARLTLYGMLNDAVIYGADYAAASAVYNNAAATAEELNAAIDAFKPIVTKALLAYAKANSTAEEPVEITKYMIVNPDFDCEDIHGWTVDKIGTNCGFQNNGSYHNEEEDIHIVNFIEAWRSGNNPLDDGRICQKIGSLPAGHYILECDGIARNQAASTDAKYVDPDDYKGIYLFYDNGSIVVHSETTLKDVESEDFDDNGNIIRKPSHFTFEFDIEDVDSLTIGLMTESTNMNWMAADNFKLSMAGSSQQLPSYVALVGEVATVAAVLEKVEADEIIAEQAVVDALEAAYNEVKPLAEAASDKSKDAEYVAAYAKLNGARNALTASEADYKKAYTFIETLLADQDKFEEKTGYEAVVAMITGLYDEFQGGYDERTLTSEAINAAIDGYDAKIKEAIQVAFDAAAKDDTFFSEEGLDITPLIEHMSYAYGTSQTGFPNGYPAENPVWMNETKTGNFKTNYSTAEVWDARPFNIYREFKNLPAGRYTIRVHALYRVEANPANFNNYWGGSYDDPDYAWLYAGSNKTHVTNIAEMGTTENINGGVEVTDPETEETLYLVNNQQGAYNLFSDEKYAEAAEKGYIGVSTNVLEDGGSFTAGIRGTENLQGNHWVLWYNFELYFNGQQESLAEDVQALLDELEELGLDGDEVVETAKLKEDARAAGEAALDQYREQQIAAIKLLQEAIAAAKQSASLVEQILELQMSYQDKKDQLDEESGGTFTDERIQDILDEIVEHYESDEFDSNAQIEAWIKELPEAWVNYILSMVELDEATVEEPVEMPIIYNPDYALSNHTEGWTYETTATSGNICNYNETYLEFWNNNVGSNWDIYQELPKLREGYYRLQVDALYRAAGSAADIDSLKADNVKYDEYLYAGEMSTPVIAWTDFEKGALLGKLDELTATEEYAGITGTQYNYERAPQDTVWFVAPNVRNDLRHFAEAGRYVNTLDFGYTSGSVRIGLKALTTYASNWSPFGSWKLFYLGTKAPDAVKDIISGEQAIKTGSLYTIDGRLIRSEATLNDLRNAGRGIYILNGKKVVVK